MEIQNKKKMIVIIRRITAAIPIPNNVTRGDHARDRSLGVLSLVVKSECEEVSICWGCLQCTKNKGKKRQRENNTKEPEEEEEVAACCADV
jgi:hypothetical protein